MVLLVGLDLSLSAALILTVCNRQWKHLALGSLELFINGVVFSDFSNNNLEGGEVYFVMLSTYKS